MVETNKRSRGEAQVVERPAFNREEAGSIPVAPTIKAQNMLVMEAFGARVPLAGAEYRDGAWYIDGETIDAFLG